MTPLEKFLTVPQAAEYLNTSERFVRRLVAERRIAFHHVGRHVRIALSDLDTWLAAGRVEPVARQCLRSRVRGVA